MSSYHYSIYLGLKAHLATALELSWIKDLAYIDSGCQHLIVDVNTKNLTEQWRGCTHCIQVVFALCGS